MCKCVCMFVYGICGVYDYQTGTVTIRMAVRRGRTHSPCTTTYYHWATEEVEIENTKMQNCTMSALNRISCRKGEKNVKEQCKIENTICRKFLTILTSLTLILSPWVACSIDLILRIGCVGANDKLPIGNMQILVFETGK